MTKPNPKAAKAKATRRANLAKRESEQKVKHTQALKDLKPMAREIKTRLEKADKMEGQADDHRLAAAIQLGAAKERCEQAGLKFKQWVEQNLAEVKLSFESARKLAAVGSADDPKLALEDMRVANAQANRRARAKAAAKKTSEKAKALPKTDGPKAPTKTPFEVATNAIGAMKQDERGNLIKEMARDTGMAIVSKEEKSILTEGWTLERLQGAFATLSKRDRVKFAKWAAAEIGATVDTGIAPAPKPTNGKAKTDAMPEIPSALDRRSGKAKARRTRMSQPANA